MQAAAFALGSVVLGSALVSPRRSTTRTMRIRANASTLYPLIARPKDGWSRWFPQGPAVEIAYEGPDEGVGAKQTWHGKVGAGSIAITHADGARSIAYEGTMGFLGIGASGNIELDVDGDDTVVRWTDELVAGLNPVARFAGIAMDRMRGRNMETALEKLKSLAEQA